MNAIGGASAAGWMRGFALVALVVCSASCGCHDEQPAAAAAEQQLAGDLSNQDVAKDQRIDYLLVPCAKREHYDVDTSEPLPILLETLQHGFRDPLRRAREELGAADHEGILALNRLIDAHFAAPDGGSFLRNAIDVLMRTEDPAAREPLLRLLRYREQSVAVLAAEALRKHGKPEDFDLVLALFEIAPPELRGKLLGTLHALDAPRAERLYLDWIEGGVNPELWESLTGELASATDPGVVERCCALWEKLTPRDQYPIAAACARSGDERALTLLREGLRSSNAGIRGLALDSFAKARMTHEIAAMLQTEEQSDLRLRALSHIAGSPRAGEHAGELRTALGDASAEVRTAAAFELARRGDSAAIEHCVAALDDPELTELSAAMQALREPMQRDPKLAERVLSRLTARRATEAQLPLEGRSALLAAIGQVPLEEAARLLHEQSRTETGQLAGMRAARWLVLQAGNTGECGARYLTTQLASERDPLRRIDLLEGIAMRGGDFARNAMVELVDGDTLSPHEILYASERLTRMGPVGVVAPLLKRVTLRVTHPEVRVAMQCLLWNNFPGPR